MQISPHALVSRTQQYAVCPKSMKSGQGRFLRTCRVIACLRPILGRAGDWKGREPYSAAADVAFLCMKPCQEPGWQLTAFTSGNSVAQCSQRSTSAAATVTFPNEEAGATDLGSLCVGKGEKAIVLLEFGIKKTSVSTGHGLTWTCKGRVRPPRLFQTEPASCFSDTFRGIRSSKLLLNTPSALRRKPSPPTSADKCPSGESVHDLCPSSCCEDVAQATNLGTWCRGMGRDWPRQSKNSSMQITHSQQEPHPNRRPPHRNLCRIGLTVMARAISLQQEQRLPPSPSNTHPRSA